MRFATAAMVLGLVTVACGSSDTPSTVSMVAITSREEMEAQIPQLRIDDEGSGGPYFGSENSSGEAGEPVAGFSPAPADEQFCWAVSVINSRPKPNDEFDEIVVANEYFVAIEKFVLPELRDEFAEVLKFTQSVMESGSFTEANEVGPDDPFIAALETINEVVDTRCLGQS